MIIPGVFLILIRECKNSVFVDLFYEDETAEENDISLYNALHDEPYRKAIEECIEKDVLADYLRKKGSEVVNMLMSEYNYEQDIEVQREEAYEEGRAKGERTLSRLIELLLADNRLEDLKKITEDEDYRKKLLKELHIE